MYKYIKRLFDIVIALLVLIAASPLMIVCAVLVALSSPGGVFFRQARVGKGCQTFQMLKFRSMVAGADQKGPYFTQKGDARITRIGAFLRKTSLDELPQLFNVLKGDMSLVGPRPDVPQQESLYASEDWQQRHMVLPGITGWAQVNGRGIISNEERAALDLEYVKRCSFWFDVSILFRTLKHLSSH